MREVEVIEISEELSFLTLYFSKALRELDRICTKTLYNPNDESKFIIDNDTMNLSKLLKVLGIDTNNVRAVWAWSSTSFCLQDHEQDVCPYISFFTREDLVKISYCYGDTKYMVVEVQKKLT